MPEATLSSKYQVTLPMDVVRALGLKGGEKLIVHLSGDHLVIMPKPENWADYWMGRLKGVYGDTKEEVDQYLAEVRHGGFIGSTTLENLLATRGTAWRVLHTIIRNGNALRDGDLRKAVPKIPDQKLNEALDALKTLGAVEEVPHELKRGVGGLYRSTEVGRHFAEIYPENRD
jgi:AbrB family looped-hinge helix DNA binding protein